MALTKAQQEQIEKARKRAYTDTITSPEHTPSSQNKSWKGFFLAGGFIGSFFGNFMESESLKDSKRHAEAAGAKAAYEEAVKLGIKGEDLADLAEEAEEKKTLAETISPKHSGTIGGILQKLIIPATLILIAAGVIGLGVLTAPFLGLPLFATLLIASFLPVLPIAGVVLDKTVEAGQMVYAKAKGEYAYGKSMEESKKKQVSSQSEAEVAAPAPAQQPPAQPVPAQQPAIQQNAPAKKHVSFSTKVQIHKIPRAEQELSDGFSR